MLIHESTGLRIRRNRNGFVVVTLHYTADPDKRSPEWEAEARQGLDDARFAREYNIDYGAARGRRAFPEISTHASSIIVQPPYPEFPSNQPFYGGFDYGLRNPSAFLVFTVWEGVTYCIWELYEPCANIIEFSSKILACPYWHSIRWIAADPHIADRRFYRADGTGSSIMDQFIAHGIHKLVTAPNSEQAWLAIMRQHWADPSNPTFRIFSRCSNLIREFQEMVYDDPSTVRSPEMTEHLVDENNHALDATKYYMLSNPRAAAPIPTPIKPRLPRWGWSPPSRRWYTQ